MWAALGVLAANGKPFVAVSGLSLAVASGSPSLAAGVGLSLQWLLPGAQALERAQSRHRFSCCKACGILFPQPRTQPVPPVAADFHPWTTREALSLKIIEPKEGSRGTLIYNQWV